MNTKPDEITLHYSAYVCCLSQVIVVSRTLTIRQHFAYRLTISLMESKADSTAMRVSDQIVDCWYLILCLVIEQS